MIDLQKIQKELWDNKTKKGFNLDDVNLEFCLAFNELGEAFQAHRKKLPDIGEELADVMLYLLSLAKMLDIDLEKEVVNKLEKNIKREYQKINGVFVRTKDA